MVFVIDHHVLAVLVGLQFQYMVRSNLVKSYTRIVFGFRVDSYLCLRRSSDIFRWNYIGQDVPHILFNVLYVHYARV